ncbi:MAG: hypothetical protein WED10_04575 [Brumimicrobium sp.]
MKTFILLLSILVIAVSCQKENLKEDELSGTTWEIWQYKESSVANPIPLNDTLVFSTDGDYTYNNQTQFYMLNDSGNAKKLSLYGTKFGDISGNISRDFDTYGEIVAEEFVDINATNNQSKYILWIRRID